MKLRQFSVAEVEAEAFGDLDRPDLYFQFYPDMYGGRRGAMAPFAFRDNSHMTSAKVLAVLDLFDPISPSFSTIGFGINATTFLHLFCENSPSSRPLWTSFVE